MNAKSITGKTPSDIQKALEESQPDGQDFKPTLAIILISNMDDAESLRSIFGKQGIAIFGVTAPQKFSEDGISEDDILVMLLDIKPDYFKIVLNDYQGSSAYEAGYNAGISGKNAFANPGFIISPLDFRVSNDELIRGLTDATGNDIMIAGGVSGDPADFSGVVFTNSVSSTGGLLALIIDQDKVSLCGLAVSGWKPVGTTKTITKSGGSWVFTIDNEPAMKVIQRYLGDEMLISNSKATGLPPSPDLGYPLQFERASGNAIAKPALFFNPADQSIMIAGGVKEGDHFRFSLPPDFDVIDKVVETTRISKEKEMPDADALLVFSCVGRLGTFGPLISTEIEGLASTWGKPMIGYFSLGEFGKLDEGRCEFQGTTVSWVALKEK
ncbi:MAG: FIST N-terminal domain-containing protein [Algoriphagus sp.]|uniref:FIST signal transduction protein n=1 Tax=Algoriphagus sp. TaxID=1872435 RepID=UPI00272EF598|nr:FIST N-terminal domain-containing protein [Algoriphagus sp.]MDP2043182.1 FIST N-terminal domain-containing protein [Algoriphagus sp.]MDP3473999.1 FIST N-terminal domain-containing protein [Algoriphagus sp.]